MVLWSGLPHPVEMYTRGVAARMKLLSGFKRRIMEINVLLWPYINNALLHTHAHKHISVSLVHYTTAQTHLHLPGWWPGSVLYPHSWVFLSVQQHQTVSVECQRFCSLSGKHTHTHTMCYSHKRVHVYQDLRWTFQGKYEAWWFHFNKTREKTLQFKLKGYSTGSLGLYWMVYSICPLGPSSMSVAPLFRKNPEKIVVPTGVSWNTQRIWQLVSTRNHLLFLWGGS